MVFWLAETHSHSLMQDSFGKVCLSSGCCCTVVRLCFGSSPPFCVGVHAQCCSTCKSWLGAFNVLHLHVVQFHREVEVLLLIFKWFGSWSLEMSRGQGCRGCWLAGCSLRSCNTGMLSVTVCTCQALPLPATPTTLLFLFRVEWAEGRVWWAVAVCVPAVICSLRVQGRMPLDVFHKTGRNKWLPTQVRKGHWTLIRWHRIHWVLLRAVWVRL